VNNLKTSLPTDSQHRKTLPIATGVLDYFPAALAEVARLSRAGNEKHNPGQPLHHARGKSSDHADCIIRHLIDRGTIDPEDGVLHDVKVAWRALALLQETLEARGLAPLPRGARAPEPTLWVLDGDGGARPATPEENAQHERDCFARRERALADQAEMIELHRSHAR
jgi:hypothetical protein